MLCQLVRGLFLQLIVLLKSPFQLGILVYLIATPEPQVALILFLELPLADTVRHLKHSFISCLAIMSSMSAGEQLGMLSSALAELHVSGIRERDSRQPGFSGRTQGSLGYELLHIPGAFLWQFWTPAAITRLWSPGSLHANTWKGMHVQILQGC